MSGADQRQELVKLLMPAYMSDQDAANWSHYVAWCLANARSPFVDGQRKSERQLLAFLHSSRKDRHWAPSTARHYMGVVRAAYKHAGLPDPAGHQVSAWYKACRRENGGERVLAKVDAITIGQIARAADNRPQELDSGIVRRRGLIALANALDVSPFDPTLGRLPATSFQVRADGIVITRPETGERVLLDAGSQPIFHASLASAIAHAEDPRHPFARKRGSDNPALVSAWRRSFARDASHGAVLAEYAVAGGTAREWWLLNLDRGLQQRILDRSYLLVGVLGGHRHATMARLTVGHFETTKTGYTYEVAPTEDKGGLLARRNGSRLKPGRRHVDHLEEDPCLCPVWCPACALSDQLMKRTHHGASGQSPLWVKVGTVAALRHEASPSSDYCVGRLRKMLGEDINDGQWVGTRSLRVTSATLARSSGMSVAEVSHHLGQYWSGSAEAYLRRVDPRGFDLVLPIGSPVVVEPI